MDKKRKRPSTDSFAEYESNARDREIERLESKATLSPKYYNNIATILSIMHDAGRKSGPDRGAAEYLVRKKRLQKDVFFLGKQNAVVTAGDRAFPGLVFQEAVRHNGFTRRIG